MKYRLLCAVFAAFSGCADPASLRVTITIEAAETDSVQLTVRRIDRISSAIDCRLRGDGTEEGRCPFEERQEPWMVGAPIDFVLYGDEGIEVEVLAQGFDALASPVTSTRARALLGAGGGPAELQLVLPERPIVPIKKRTEVHQRCSIAFPVSPGQREQTAVTLFDHGGDGTLELVAASPRRFSLVKLRKSESGCTLEETETPLTPVCGARAQGLLVGELDPSRPGPEVLAACSPRGSPYRLRLLTFDESGAVEELERLELSATINQVTHPVLFDPDGDGVDEVAFVAASSSAALDLVTWSPAAGGPERRRRLRNVFSNGVNNSNVTHAPIVLRREGGRDDLLLAGYRGGSARYDAVQDRVIERAGNTPASAIGASLVFTGARAIVAGTNNNGGTLSFASLDGELAGTATVSLRFVGQSEISVAIGDVDGDGIPSALWAVDHRLAIARLEGAGPRPGRELLLEGSFSGPMVVLLANLDGAPGAEILVFGPTSDFLQLVDQDGRPLEGWPVMAGSSGAPNRVVIADLDRDGSAEIAVISHEGLTVLSLGPGSYDRQEMPWPFPFRDRRQSAALSTPGEPFP